MINKVIVSGSDADFSCHIRTENSLGVQVFFAIISKHVESDGVAVQVGHKCGLWNYQFSV